MPRKKFTRFYLKALRGGYIARAMVGCQMFSQVTAPTRDLARSRLRTATDKFRTPDTEK